MSFLLFTYYKVSHMGNWKISSDLGRSCGCCFFLITLLAQRYYRNDLEKYPNISLVWIYQWELAGDSFQWRQAGVSMRPISFSCGVDLSRSLQVLLPKNLRIPKMFNIHSSLFFILVSFLCQIQSFCCIMDSVLVIVKLRCHTKLCTALSQHRKQWE